MSWLDLLMQQFPMPSSAPPSGSFLPEPQSNPLGGFLPTSPGGGLPTFSPDARAGGLPAFLPESGTAGGSTFLGGGASPVDAVMGILGGVGQRLGAKRTVELAQATDAAAKAAAAKAKAAQAPAVGSPSGSSGGSAATPASARFPASTPRTSAPRRRSTTSTRTCSPPWLSRSRAGTRPPSPPPAPRASSSSCPTRRAASASPTPGMLARTSTGARYLANFVNTQYPNDLPRALAAYNAGPGAVQQYGGVPPFPETQRYVQGVQQYYQQYRTAPPPPATVAAPAAAYAPCGPYPAGGNPCNIAFDFNQPYSTPLSSGTAVHRGVDLTIPGAANNGRGTPYQAFVPGVVRYLTQDPDGGHGIIVQTQGPSARRPLQPLLPQRPRARHRRAAGRAPGRPAHRYRRWFGDRIIPHLHFEVSRGVNGDRRGRLSIRGRISSRREWPSERSGPGGQPEARAAHYRTVARLQHLTDHWQHWAPAIAPDAKTAADFRRAAAIWLGSWPRASSRCKELTVG